MVLVMTGGSHERYKTDGKFDYTKWKASMDAFNTPQMRDAVREGVANGTIVMNSVMDEPQIKDWGGVMTKPLLDQMAAYVKALFPTLPVGVVVRWDWRLDERYQVMDVILAQYQWNKGDVVAYRDNVLAQARLDGVEVLFSMNVIGGGIYSWKTQECPIPLTGGPSGFPPNCRVTPDQLRDWGRILGVAGCAMTFWRYDAEFWANPANVQAMNDVAATLSTVPARPCRRLGTSSVPPTPANIRPIAAFDPPGCAVGVACQFTDGSSDTDGTLRSWSWDFGNGATSTEANPSHTFATTGSHDVTLEVTDNAGGTHRVTRTVTVDAAPNIRPTAAFDPPSCTVGVACQFTDGSSDTDGTLRSWSWGFGNGATSTEANPSHTFATTGSHDITLEVTDNAGGTHRVTRTVTVEAAPNIQPTAAFDPPGCTSGVACRFTDGSSDEDGTLTAWSWDFGEGGSSTRRNPSRTYAAEGSYSVTLAVTDNRGGSAMVTHTVIVEAGSNIRPTAAFDPPNCTAKAACQFTDGSSDEGGTLTAWSWDFGNGAGSTDANPSHTFPTSGSHSVTLEVTDDAGGTDAVTRTVTVEPAPNIQPTAAFDAPSCTSGVACRFTDRSGDEDGTLSAWSWDFGDGGSSTQQNPSRTFADAGTYSVILEVTDNAGGTDAVTRTVTVEARVNAQPSAAFTSPSCTVGVACQFTDGSSDEDGTVDAWSWDFGDGGSSTQQNPSRTFAEAGTFSVTLSVTDDAGGTDAVTRTVTVEANIPPTAAFTAPECTAEAACQFTDGSSDDDGTLSAWSWDFGDGGSSIQQSPSRTYTAPGSYDVTLEVTDDAGATAAFTRTVAVEARPNTPPRAAFDPPSCTVGTPCPFSDASSDDDGTLSAWSWDFGDGSRSTLQNPTRTYGSAGTYTVTLSVTDNNLASHSQSGAVVVTAAPVPIVLSVTGRVDATKQYMALTWTNTPGVSVDVYRNGVFLLNTPNDGGYTNSRQLPGSPSYTYKVCQVGSTFCSNEATVTFSAPTQNVLPVANFTARCSGLTCTFTSSSTDSDGVIVSWSWTFGDGSRSTARNPTRTFATAGTFTVTLKVTDDKGGTHQRSASIKVGSIVLSVSGRVDATKQYMTLSWTGASGTMVNVYRNNVLIKNTENDGRYTNSRTFLGPATYIYRVCETAGTKCSNNATVIFK
jgi:PKD repeat protein